MPKLWGSMFRKNWVTMCGYKDYSLQVKNGLDEKDWWKVERAPLNLFFGVGIEESLQFFKDGYSMFQFHFNLPANYTALYLHPKRIQSRYIRIEPIVVYLSLECTLSVDLINVISGYMYFQVLC